jgi:2-oxoglutarate ferredoxin oxidoreductase subunit alpha
MKGLQHRIGGIEKEDKTGNISYDPLNHQKMVRLRAEKVRQDRGRLPAYPPGQRCRRAASC